MILPYISDHYFDDFLLNELLSFLFASSKLYSTIKQTMMWSVLALALWASQIGIYNIFKVPRWDSSSMWWSGRSTSFDLGERKLIILFEAVPTSGRGTSTQIRSSQDKKGLFFILRSCFLFSTLMSLAVAGTAGPLQVSFIPVWQPWVGATWCNQLPHNGRFTVPSCAGPATGTQSSGPDAQGAAVQGPGYRGDWWP